MSELQGIGRFTFYAGKLEEFKRLSARCMEIARTRDTGTLQYEIYFNDDQSECIVLERYRDSDALIEHGGHSANSPGQSSRRDRSPARASASRTQSSERSSPEARSSSSHPTC